MVVRLQNANVTDKLNQQCSTAECMQCYCKYTHDKLHATAVFNQRQEQLSIHAEVRMIARVVFFADSALNLQGISSWFSESSVLFDGLVVVGRAISLLAGKLLAPMATPVSFLLPPCWY